MRRILLSIFFLAFPLYGGTLGDIISEKTYQVPDTIEMRTYKDVILDCGKAGEGLFRCGAFGRGHPAGCSPDGGRF